MIDWIGLDGGMGGDLGRGGGKGADDAGREMWGGEGEICFSYT